MKVRDEIQQFSTPENRPILEWLFDRYHWASQWSFVATFSPQLYGTESYKIHRVWKPTVEGRAIYSMLSGVKCPDCEGGGEVETGIVAMVLGDAPETLELPEDGLPWKEGDYAN